MYRAFLIKYAEIGTKGKNRYLFEDALIDQIKRALKDVDGEFAVSKESGRIYVEPDGECDADDVTDALSRVFGICGICPMVQIDDNGLSDLKENCVRCFKEEYGDRAVTFKVKARRARKNYPLDSMELASEIGEAILLSCENASVDVHNPDVLFNVEIRNRINIYSKTITGPGGMPVGCAGKATLLLSGGIDSPVAGYMMAKRGVKIDAVYFHAPPYTSERAKQKVVDLARQISRYCGGISLHVVNFTDIQLYIYEKCPHDELTIIMRRYMMRIAEHFAREGGSLGLVTGESVGQVASQTMHSLAATNDVCTMPVYRPLIAFDKQEIVDIAERIGTYETSVLPYEDCCTIFVATHPVTKPSVRKMRASEKKLSEKIDELVAEAISSAQLIEVE